MCLFWASARVTLRYPIIHTLFFVTNGVSPDDDENGDGKGWRMGSLRTGRPDEARWSRVDSTFYPEKSSIDHPLCFPKTSPSVYTRARAADILRSLCISTRTWVHIREGGRWRVPLHHRNISKYHDRGSAPLSSYSVPNFTISWLGARCYKICARARSSKRKQDVLWIYTRRNICSKILTLKLFSFLRCLCKVEIFVQILKFS